MRPMPVLALAAALVGAVGLTSCGEESAHECTTSRDCASGSACVDGRCAERGDGGRVDAGGGVEDGGPGPGDAGPDRVDGGEPRRDAGRDGATTADASSDDGGSGRDGGPPRDAGGGDAATGSDAGPGTTARLTLMVVGADGVVRVLPPGGGCVGPMTCTYDYPTGTSVTLSPRPDPGSMACPWVEPTECIGVSGNCTIVMDRDRLALVQFAALGEICLE